MQIKAIVTKEMITKINKKKKDKLFLNLLQQMSDEADKWKRRKYERDRI